MFKYIVDSEATAKSLSALIYKLMYPADFTPSGEENYLFGWEFEDPDWVILIPENYECPIFQKPEFESTIEELGEILKGAFKKGEGDQLIDYLKTGRIILENIIPSGLVRKI